MSKARVGTTWLDACSGCHMSLLDMDERLIELAERIELVYSPLVDAKEVPEGVDVFLITGSVSTDRDVEKVRHVRERTRLLVALGDCAVTGNVPSLRNLFGPRPALERAYEENVSVQPQTPHEELPALLRRVVPVHEIVKVDAYVQGCPPHAELIHFILNEMLQGRLPGRGVRTRFG